MYTRDPRTEIRQIMSVQVTTNIWHFCNLGVHELCMSEHEAAQAKCTVWSVSFMLAPSKIWLWVWMNVYIWMHTGVIKYKKVRVTNKGNYLILSLCHHALLVMFICDTKILPGYSTFSQSFLGYIANVSLWFPLICWHKGLHIIVVTQALVVCLICTPSALGPAALRCTYQVDYLCLWIIK